MLSEAVASKELTEDVYEVCATAEAQYDDARCELLVEQRKRKVMETSRGKSEIHDSQRQNQ